ncbi:hypothetical protein P0082_01530 [Candidatus Haliotispira prima]|uniref:Chorismate mutase n=1 Tax=Candidatus Haliotispira prima TaxID=3034016 RepID=A0ABY8MHS1_9SPIO|nr:hypothetical protein P0082_01530 [Candidatus Haliotispira prima]
MKQGLKIYERRIGKGLRVVVVALNIVAKRLELLEETLIYRFLDRVQFAFYPALCQSSSAAALQTPGGKRSPEVVLSCSLLGLRLKAHEAMDQSFGRYDVTEEFPFTEVAEQSCAASSPVKPLVGSQTIRRKLAVGDDSGSEADLPLSLGRIREISQCRAILQHYLEFLEQYCPPEPVSQVPEVPDMGQEMHYGSALEQDVIVLQAVSRRIHYGAVYVAESKFRRQESQLRPLLEQWQRYGEQSAVGKELQEEILAAITRVEVEQDILQRVHNKAGIIQSMQSPRVEIQGADGYNLQRYYLEPRSLRDFYANCIIPLTKRGELAYLYRRI